MEIEKIDNQLNIISEVPRWHFSMLNDMQRNQAFFDAIKSTDFYGKTVLDIGSGSGLLAMLIAQRGALHVYTCESNTFIATQAEKIIRNNALQNNITVINKLSMDLISGVDIPADIDVLISETVDCGFFGEGFGKALLHAQHRLIKYDAEIIPKAVKLHACLLSSKDICNLNSIQDDIFGLDISEFNKFKTDRYFPVRLKTWSYKLISKSINFYSAVFEPNFSIDRRELLTFAAETTALAHGVLFWFDLHLKESIYLSNSPLNTNSHWMQAVQLFDEPTNIQVGNEYQVEVSISSGGIVFGRDLKKIIT